MLGQRLREYKVVEIGSIRLRSTVPWFLPHCVCLLPYLLLILLTYFPSSTFYVVVCNICIKVCVCL